MNDRCRKWRSAPVRSAIVILGVLLAATVALWQEAAIAAKLSPIKGEEVLSRNLWRTPVSYRTDYPPGSIIIDTSERYLYFITGPGTALRYGVAVGREGKEWEGSMKVTKKREWPDWRPTRGMRMAAKAKGKPLPKVVPGGPNNPLGARAIYLGRSQYRIHGTTAPQSIGKAASSGCIRMLNEHVIDLYDRVELRARVVVLP
jgi:lipoprotein-anchoring transpeptidase ErfK/SrfK